MRLLARRVIAVTAAALAGMLAVVAVGCGAVPLEHSQFAEIADQLGLTSLIPIVAGEVWMNPAVPDADNAPGAATSDGNSAPASDGPDGGGSESAGDLGTPGPALGAADEDAPATQEGEEAFAGDDATAGGSDGDAPAGSDGDVLPSDAESPADLPSSDAAALNGVYVLGLEGASAAVLAPYLSNPDVDGFSLRAGWSDVEPADDAYDWSQFDAVIEAAAAHGKKVMLRVLPGLRTPEWVYEAGAARFEFVDDNPNRPTYGEVVSMPLPWDPVFLTKWSDLVAAFGARYAANPAVTLVAMTGPAAGGEMHLGDKSNADRWHDLGYSNELLIDTWKLTIDAFSAAFPNQHRTVAVANPVLFDNPAEVRAAVAAYCAESGCGLQGNWLAAKTSPTGDLYQQIANHAAAAPVGFQMLCSATQERFGGELMTAVDLALEAGASFLEVYRVDVAEFPDAIAYAHEQLNLTSE